MARARVSLSSHNGGDSRGRQTRHGRGVPFANFGMIAGLIVCFLFSCVDACLLLLCLLLACMRVFLCDFACACVCGCVGLCACGACVQGFDLRSQRIACGPERALVVAHGENWAAKDVISNKQVLLALCKNKAFQTLEEKATWMMAFRDFDRERDGKLAKTTGKTNLDNWSRKEWNNLKGCWRYFVDKLCKSGGSHSDDIKELKKAYYENSDATPNATSKAMPAPTNSAPEESSAMDYPAEDSDFECDGSTAVAEVPSADKKGVEMIEDSDDECEVVTSTCASGSTCASSSVCASSSATSARASTSGTAASKLEAPSYVKASLSSATSLGYSRRYSEQHTPRTLPKKSVYI